MGKDICTFPMGKLFTLFSDTSMLHILTKIGSKVFEKAILAVNTINKFNF